jgi:hypothetical protein
MFSASWSRRKKLPDPVIVSRVKIGKSHAAKTAATPAYLLRLRPAGMFSNVNEVVQQLHLSEQGGYEFLIDWSLSCYRDPAHDADPWSYYFEQPFATPRNGELDELPGGPSVACARDNIITPRVRDGVCDSLLLPKDRYLPNRIIERYLRLLPPIRQRIETFRRTRLDGRYVALHIRGAGRTDGGVPGLRSGLPLTAGVPLETYFFSMDRCLQEDKDVSIFACSDSRFVLDAICDRYGKRVVTYPAQRSEFGEMHVVGKKENAGESFDRRRLGEEVLIEAYLLAGADFLVHGNSNVANFVLCLAPGLRHHYVYENKQEVLRADLARDDETPLGD